MALYLKSAIDIVHQQWNNDEYIISNYTLMVDISMANHDNLE